MFDGLAHGIPFISSNIGFFREFVSSGLGMSVNSSVDEFSAAILAIEEQYSSYKENVDHFKQNLLWSSIAESHKALYVKMIQNKAAGLIISC
jgi:glycosyltransferase involved in cell wall biosynthesis